MTDFAKLQNKFFKVLGVLGFPISNVSSRTAYFSIVKVQRLGKQKHSCLKKFNGAVHVCYQLIHI